MDEGGPDGGRKGRANSFDGLPEDLVELALGCAVGLGEIHLHGGLSAECLGAVLLIEWNARFLMDEGCEIGGGVESSVERRRGGVALAHGRHPEDQLDRTQHATCRVESRIDGSAASVGACDKKHRAMRV